MCESHLENYPPLQLAIIVPLLLNAALEASPQTQGEASAAGASTGVLPLEFLRD